MHFSDLSQWLAWQESLHFKEIDLGLPRIATVLERMGRTSRLPFKVVTIAGTNGKGSSAAILSAILQAAGYRTGTYSSPHIMAYNERICINSKPASDVVICSAFNHIERARDDISLTYFEFATLAAIDIFCDEQVDIAVLEVGMGGRLDATNALDADIALITPIALDHTQWLGDTREKIGFEKAGIIREKSPVVCSENDVPRSVIDYAESLQSPSFIQDRHFSYQVEADSWTWQSNAQQLTKLPMPNLTGSYQLQNSAAVLQVCELLNQQDFTIDESAIRQGLQSVQLAGRFQIIEGDVTRILDVTHNQHGARNLRQLLLENSIEGKTYALLAILKDKEPPAVAEILDDCVDGWFLAGLDGNRGIKGIELKTQLSEVINTDKLHSFEQVSDAYKAVMEKANTGDRVLIFGSFHTIEAAMNIISNETDNG